MKKFLVLSKKWPEVISRLMLLILSGGLLFSETVFLKADDKRSVEIKIERLPDIAFSQPVQLRCEYEINPIGIDILKPRFSWEPGIDQKAWQIEVIKINTETPLSAALTSTGKIVWDSGRVESGQSVNVVYQGSELQSDSVYRWRVKVWDQANRQSNWSAPSIWSTGILRSSDWNAEWFSTELFDKDKNGKSFLTSDDSPLVRYCFELKDQPVRAFSYVNVMGYFELYVNGQKISPDVLSPAVVRYDKRSLYKIYDIASYLKKGDNIIGLHLSKGWYSAPNYGASRKTALARFQANLYFADGSSQRIVSDKDWQCHPSDRSLLGKWIWNQMGGERVDARKTISDWAGQSENAGKDKSGNNLTSDQKSKNTAGSKADGSWRNVQIIDAPKVTSEFDRTPPIRVIKEIAPVKMERCFVNTKPESKTSVKNDGKSETILIDFGTNMTGVADFVFSDFESGQTVRMEYADRLDPWQSMNQYDEFVSAGQKNELFASKFNYHGFRYVYVTWPKGKKGRIVSARAKAIAHQFETVGSFECSDPMFNRMHQVTLWTLKALSLGGFMSDCPHRERIGYGDGQLSIESCIMNFNMASFYAKWGRDWTDCVEEDGYIYHNAPQKFKSGGGPGWGGTLAALGWRSFLFYENKDLTAEVFDTAAGHIRALDARSKDGVLQGFGGKWDFLGDWVPPGRGMDTENWPSRRSAEQFNNCYKIYLQMLQTKMADALGKEDLRKEYETKSVKNRPAVHKEFFDEKNRYYVVDEQAYYVMALLSKIVPKDLRNEINARLEKNILQKNKGHLDTGMLGTYFLLNYLMEIGRDDLVETIVAQKTYPGWGYMLEKGATTWWEQWNAYYSQIHSCFCSLDGWFYEGIAGIRPDEKAPAFRHFTIKPALLRNLTWAEAQYHSLYGPIKSRWERTVPNEKKNINGSCKISVSIPGNTSADLVFPLSTVGDNVEKDLKVNLPKDLPRGITFIEKRGNSAIFKVRSGEYRFEIK